MNALTLAALGTGSVSYTHLSCGCKCTACGRELPFWRRRDGGGGGHGSGPVSYTHLDVYKRQVIKGSGSVSGRRSMSGTEGECGMTIWDTSFKAVFVVAVPITLAVYACVYVGAVSYTHLDVYKRQIPSRPLRRSVPLQT